MERKWRWRERWMVGSICAIAYACWQYLCWQVRVSTRSPAQRDNSWEDTHHTQEKKLNGTIKQICCTNKCVIMFSFSFLVLCEMRYKINKHIFITRNIFFFCQLSESLDLRQIATGHIIIRMHEYQYNSWWWQKKIGSITGGKNVSCCETRFNFTAPMLCVHLFFSCSIGNVAGNFSLQMGIFFCLRNLYHIEQWIWIITMDNAATGDGIQLALSLNLRTIFLEFCEEYFW